MKLSKKAVFNIIIILIVYAPFLIDNIQNNKKYTKLMHPRVNALRILSGVSDCKK